MKTPVLARIVCICALISAVSTHAASIVLTNSDAAGVLVGASSFTSKGLWDDSLAPQGTNDYYTQSTNSLRTPQDAVGYIFQGNSLNLQGPGSTLAGGGRLITKNSTAATYTITNLVITNLGMIHAAGGTAATTIAGNISETNGWVLLPANGPLVISASVSGDGPLFIGSTSQVSSASVTLSGSISNFTGAIYQTNSSSALIFNNAINQTFSGVIATTNVNTLLFQGAGIMTLTGANTYRGSTTLGASGGAAVVRVANSAALSTNTIILDTTGNGSTARLELTNGVTLNNAITLSGRTSSTIGIQNLGGNNTLGGTITVGAGGSQYWIQSDSGLLTLSAPISISASSGTRVVTLQGAGNGRVAGVITNGAANVSIVKTGAGTWTFAGTNSYTGPTTVSNGTLAVSGIIGSNTLTVAGGTFALSGSGSISNGALVVLNSPGTLDVSAATSFALGSASTLTGSGTVVGNYSDSPGSTMLPGGAGAVGTLTFSNNLNLAASGTNKFDFFLGSNDLVVVNGNLNPSAGTIINLATKPAGGFTNGDYTLFQVSGTLGGSAGNFVLTGKPTPSRQTFNIVYDTVSSPKRVLLQVGGSSASLVWLGSAAPWDILNTADWTNAASLSTDVYFDGDNVSFTDLGSAISPVLNTNVQPGSVTFNSANSYSLSGNGSINGSSGLTKSGSGTVTVLNTNGYTGVTTLSGGKLNIAAITNGGVASPIGAASSASANIIFNGGTLQYSGVTGGTDRGATLNASGGTVEVTTADTTLSLGAIAGSAGGSLTKSGNGTLVLTGANTYDGTTVIGAGVLQIGAGGATGSLAGTGGITDNTALVANRTGTLVLSNNISGPGSITNNGPGTLVLAGTNTYLGSTVISTGIVQVVSTRALGATPAAFDPAHIYIVTELEAGTSFSIDDTNSGITALAGTIGVDSGMTLTISNEIFSTTSLTKSRPGTLILTGSNTLNVLNIDTASQTGSDGAVRITTTNAIAGVQTIQARNNQGPASSTLQLDGTAGSLDVSPPAWTWSGRNNFVPTVENIAGNNIWNPATVTLNAGGTYYIFQCDAGSLTLPGSFPASAPIATRAFTFGGPGYFSVTGSIQSGGSTNLGIFITNNATLTLWSGNSYSGVTSVQGGTMNVADGASFGTSLANIEIAPYTGETGTLNLSNSYVTAQRVIIGGVTGNNTSPGTGTLNQSGGTFDSYQWFTVGSGGNTAGNAGGTGTFNLSGGTLNLHSQQIEVGNFPASSGTVNLSGSSAINLWSGSFLALGANANAGNGTFNQNGGSVTFYSDTGGTIGGNGALYLGRATGLTNSYVYNLNGGTLTVPQITSASGNSLFYFNGGTLAAARTNVNFMTNLTAAFVSTNGATIDSGSSSLAIDQPLIHDPVLGLSPDGGLTNQSSAFNGALALNGTNTYTGKTVINSGTLNINGSIASGAVTINGGTLGGFGVVNGATTLALGTNAPGGPGQVGTLTISNNFTAQAGTLQFDMTRSSNDVLAVSGAVNVSAPTTLLLAFPSPNVGTYTLISYGSLSGFGNLSLALTAPNPRFGFSLVNNTGAKAIQLVVTGNSANLVWKGDGGFNGWDNAGTYQNWLKSGTPDFFFDGDLVTFDNTGNSAAPINLQGVVSPGSVTVNATANYDFANSGGSIAGVGGLTKSGSGTLTIEENNTYSGTTLINAGVIQVGNGGTSGSLGTGVVTNNASLVFAHADQIILPSPIYGSGTVTLAGANITASSSNYYTGATLINSGITYLQNAAGLGATNGNISVANAAQLYITANVDNGGNPLSLVGTGDGNGALRKGGAGATTYNGAVSLAGDTSLSVDGSATLNLAAPSGVNGAAANANVTLVGPGAGTFGGPLALGSGGLTVTSGAWTFAPTNSFTGLTAINGGTARVTGGSLGNPAAFTANQITFSGGALQAITNATFDDGKAGFTLNANTTFTVDSGATLTISNEITGSTALTKAGAGTLVLNGSNPFNGTLNVDTANNAGANDGILRIASPNALANVPVSPGTATISQRNNNSAFSVLQLDGTLGNVTLAQDMNLSCRNVATANIENVSGSNTLSGTLNAVQGGNTLAFQSDAGTLNLAGNLQYIGALNGVRTYTFSGAGAILVSGIITAPTVTNAPINVTVNGPGTLMLANANTYPNTTTVNGGLLLVNGSINSSNGVFVAGGTLGGTGAINDAVSVTGGTLSPGVGGIGTLTINSNLTLAGTAFIEVNKTSGLRDQVVGVNNLAYSGTLFATNLSGTLNIGDSFTVFSALSPSGNFTSITGSPGAGKAWSFNPTTGVLSVVVGINPNPTNITYNVSGSLLSLSWPADHIGWVLQTQTNSLSTGLFTNWVDVAGSSSVVSTNFTIDPLMPTTFFRLRLP